MEILRGIRQMQYCILDDMIKLRSRNYRRLVSFEALNLHQDLALNNVRFRSLKQKTCTIGKRIEVWYIRKCIT